MKFCLDLSHHPWARGSDPARAVEATLRAIRVADEAGLDSVWLSEDPDGWDAFAVLGAAARQTVRVRLGTGVTNPYLRHPNLIAMSVATLDRLSDGRAFLGLGRGQPEWYERSLGVPAGRPVGALAETIDLLRQWWQPPHRASAAGHFTVRDWPRAIAPLQAHVPIYLAALGPRAQRVATERADGLLVADFASEPYLAGLIPALRARVATAGRDPDAFAVFVRTAIEVTDDPEPVLERRKSLLALLGPLPGNHRQIAVPGFDVPAIMERVRRVMHTDEVLARGGGFIDIRRVADFAAARRLIPTELVAAVSYVGPAAAIRARLQALAGIGVTHVFVAPPGERDAAEEAALIASVAP
ncbi:MAG TPA: LLM class flavin-dependent oxidoreductase [Thermomicrobiaceae bacterium]|nr:LLM class flavin-dependent oxidoreductase [Thermomicrobiaceae bacterium]